MNEMTKLPQGGSRTDAGTEQPRRTLIERAVESFDQGHFLPPPVPADLPPAIRPPAMPQPAMFPGEMPMDVGPAAIPTAIPVVAPAESVAEAMPWPEPVATAAPEPAHGSGWSPRLYHEVDRGALLDAGLILPESGGSANQEEFRIVKRQLLLQAEDLRRQGVGGASQRVMICSPHPGEGKTFCAINLAMSIAAEKDSEVLLVDLDIARSSVLETLGLPAGPGLMDALADPALDVRDCVIGTDIPGLSVLPGGQPTALDTEYLASSRAAQVLDLLTAGAPRRIVLFDTPPALVASLPAEVAKLVGQVVMVVLADRTSAGAVEDAVSLLAGCPNIQLLLNAVQFSPSGRRFGSYYGYRG